MAADVGEWTPLPVIPTLSSAAKVAIGKETMKEGLTSAATSFVGGKVLSAVGGTVLGVIGARLGKGAAKGVIETLPTVTKTVNSNLPHALDRAIEHGIFPTREGAATAFRSLGDTITRSGWPANAVRDTARVDRVLVPIGENGMAVYQVGKNGTAKLKTVLIAR